MKKNKIEICLTRMNWKKQRQQSYFYNMRRYHNGIKRELYNRYTNGKEVLELAVGRFGDIGKLYDNDVKRIVGYDINEGSIREAWRRLEEYPEEFRKGVKLGVKDLSKEEVKENERFDVICAMFSFHYFWRTEETFKTIMRTINENIKEGGIFMGTMFDGESVERRLNYPFNDEHFKIEKRSDNSSNFGRAINVLLKETVLDKAEDEYIVNFGYMVEQMRINGFELVESKLFSKYNININLSETEKDVSYLNRTFVFTKKGTLGK